MIALFHALRRRHNSLRASRDGGTSMVEVVMAMALMSVCGAIFVGSVVGLNRTTGKAQAATNSATQTNQAYQVVDKLVRSASAITTPARSAGTGDWYVELRDLTSGSEICIQLRLDITTRSLQKRSWSAANPSDVTAWKPIAEGFTNGAVASGSTDQPFVLTALTPTAKNQRLTVNLVATAGNPPSVTTSRSSFSLTALNSAVPPPSGSVCQQVTRP